MSDYVYTVKETAALLKTTPKIIRKLINEGKLKALKIGDTKIPAMCIDEFIEIEIQKH